MSDAPPADEAEAAIALDDDLFVVSGRCRVTAFDRSRITVYGDCELTAYDDCLVTVYGPAASPPPNRPDP
jgi:hypothetical protein